VLSELIPLIQERIKLLTEAASIVDWALVGADAISYPDPSLLIGKKMSAAETIQALQAGADILANIDEFTTEKLEAAFRAQAEVFNVKLGSFFQPFRVALTGKTVSPPLFESMVILGRTEALQRVQNAIQALQAYAMQIA
jgi:glutamyl-tRNA synthetase